MFKRFYTIMTALTVIAAALSAQAPSSGVWPLSADQSAVVTGDITAASQALTGMQVSYSSGVQRSSPAGTAGTWPGETDQVASRYMEFAVSPKSNFDFTVTAITMLLYVNSGSSMKANVYYSTDPTFATKSQIGSTFSLSNSTPSSPNVAGSSNVVVTSGSTLYLRIYPWYTSSTTGKYLIVKDVTISGTTLNATAPIISLSTSDVPDFGQVVAGSSSASSSYTVSGINLLSNIVVKAPSGFKVSSDDNVFTDSVSIIPSSGTVSNVQVFVRFMPANPSGAVKLNIDHSSSGATTKSVSVSGIAIATEPTLQSALAFSQVSGTSITASFSGGNGSRRILVARKDSAVSFIPTDGNSVAGVDSNYSVSTDLGNGNKIVYDGAASSATIAGLATGTRYYFASFEYNIGDPGSENYLITNPGLKDTTTLALPGLEVNTGIIDFGNTVINSKKVKSYSLSGKFLTAAGGTIVVSAPPGFLVSDSQDSSGSASMNVEYSGGGLQNKTIFVIFKPDSDSLFSGEVTNVGGGASTVNVTVNGVGIVEPLLPDSIPFGFASLGGGTTGGQGGDTIVVTSAQQISDIMTPREKTSDLKKPVVLLVSGLLNGFSDEVDIKRTANVSIIGIGNDAIIRGFGLKIVESSNIIIRNITFSDCTAGEHDGMSIEGSNNVWVDHCSFTDSPSIDVSGSNHDGLLDVKKESYNVTISYNHFMNHRKTCLFGHSKSETGDVVMRVTYYRNWFDGTYSRHPRARYGKAHIINNYYSGTGVVGTDKGGYGVGSTCGAHLLVEANYFEDTPTPTLISQVNDPGETLSGDPVGYLKEVGNVTVNSGAIVENTNGYDFDPSTSYTYVAADANSVKSIVMATAGAGKLDVATPPVVTSEHTTTMTTPFEFDLRQNFPNPFNPSTTIQFSVADDRSVTLKIFNAIGQEIETLYTGSAVKEKLYSIQFRGDMLPSGLYFTVLESAGERSVRKMILMK